MVRESLVRPIQMPGITCYAVTAACPGRDSRTCAATKHAPGDYTACAARRVSRVLPVYEAALHGDGNGVCAIVRAQLGQNAFHMTLDCSLGYSRLSEISTGTSPNGDSAPAGSPGYWLQPKGGSPMHHHDAEMALVTRPDPIGCVDGPVERRFDALDPNQLSPECRLIREELHRERARIARELHDSLLQGFVCASMHLFAALSQIPEDSPGKPSLRHAHRLVERAIDEARNVIQDLREPGRAPLNLERALSLVHEEFNIGSGACFRMSVKGQRCVLDPAIQEQVFLISREARQCAAPFAGCQY